MQEKLESEFKELVLQIKRYNGKESDIDLLSKAWEYTKLSHLNQKRLSGEPYASHGLYTAKNLVEWKLDMSSILAGFLHDTVEDGKASVKEIKEIFGGEVAGIVDGVTKVSKVKLRGSKDEAFVENLRKMFLAMAKDLRVVFVKLADRLHNMRTLSSLPEEKQKRIASETLEIFAPLAERLGMGEVKAQLDDLAFPYVYPREYEKVTKESLLHYKDAEKFIRKMKRRLLKKLACDGIRAKIDGRKKHLYSLWIKLERPGIDWDFNKIHDIVALRIMVDTVSQCYSTLGTVHNMYKQVPYFGVSDFISQPKPNGYRSIHTRVFGEGGRVSEVQIRTHGMHQQAEYGLAAHWSYALAKTKGTKEKSLDAGIKVDQEKFGWVRQLVSWQEEIKDSEEYLRAVKFDALEHRNFIFSPKGDVFDLPEGATPIDFAFTVHTGLGDYIKSAKVNGKLVPLNYKLKSGDICEIIKTKNPRPPNKGWLDFITTKQAENAIKRKVGK